MNIMHINIIIIRQRMSHVNSFQTPNAHIFIDISCRQSNDVKTIFLLFGYHTPLNELPCVWRPTNRSQFTSWTFPHCSAHASGTEPTPVLSHQLQRVARFFFSWSLRSRRFSFHAHKDLVLSRRKLDSILEATGSIGSWGEAHCCKNVILYY